MNNLIFFGTGSIALGILEQLSAHSIVPALVITSPDAPVGRAQTITASPVGQWAEAHSTPTLKPAKIDEAFLDELSAATQRLSAEVFVVADYGKILPQTLLDIPSKGVVNVHPALLPRLRGPSPIRSAILTDEKVTGASIMLIDALMDHGPLLAQKTVPIPTWPIRGRDLDTLLSREGGALLADVLPRYLAGDITPTEQDHTLATKCRMIKKEDAQLDLAHGDPYENLLKICAYDEWPTTYAFFNRGGKSIRTQIIAAHMDGASLVIDTVKPEGKGEMPYADFIRSGATPA